MRLFLFSLLIATNLAATPVPDPPREFRASWVATVYNIDWPSKPGLPAKTQKLQLTKILDDAAAWNLNAVILQIRPSGDALYQSKIEPWSAFLSGKEGRSPGYDPLAFAIAGAHERGLELHAWFNPFRPAVAAGKYHPANHVLKKRPSAARTYRGKPWLDPGDPWVREYTLKVIADVVRRYDIDGAHIDDYFYPYPPIGQKCDFPDATTYAAHGNGMDRDAWRRSNSDQFVKAFYATVKQEKPWVKVGISPFGIWRPGHPQGIEAQLDSYAHIYADSRKWLRQGWCDYFAPQLYWRDKPRAQSFTGLLEWWQSQNVKKRHLWPGIATSRIDSTEDPGRPASEIALQVDAARNGHIHWSHKALAQNRGGVHSLLAPRYTEKALVPASPWLGRDVMEAPQLKKISAQQLSWETSGAARFVTVQTLEHGKWKLIAVKPAGKGIISFNRETERIAVRCVDRLGNLGPVALK